MRWKKNGMNRVYWAFKMEFSFIFISAAIINRTLNETIKMLCKRVISTSERFVERRLCCHFSFIFRKLHNTNNIDMHFSFSMFLRAFDVFSMEMESSMVLGQCLAMTAFGCLFQLILFSEHFIFVHFSFSGMFYPEIYWQFVIIIIQPFASAMQSHGMDNKLN